MCSSVSIMCSGVGYVFFCQHDAGWCCVLSAWCGVVLGIMI